MGDYLPNFINDFSITNNKIKHNAISIENLNMYKDILHLAIEIKESHKCGGYDTSTYTPVFSNDNNYNSYIFNMSDLEQFENFILRFGYNTLELYSSYVYYTENVRAINGNSTGFNQKNNRANYNSNYEKLCICVPVTQNYYRSYYTYYNSGNILYDLSENISVKNHNIKDTILSNNVNLKLTDLTKMNGVTLHHNKIVSGYLQDKSDLALYHYPNYTTIRIDSRVFTDFKTLKNMYIKIDNNEITDNISNFFCGVQIGVFGYNLKLSAFSSSQYYDSETGLFNLGAFLQANRNFINNYQIFGFALNSDEIMFYTDLLEKNENYNFIKNIVDNSNINASVNIFNSIGAIGDSYTAGSTRHSDNTWSDVRNQSYIAVMGKHAGVDYSNYGVGGASTRTYLTLSNGLARVLADTPKDFYMLALGINDTSLGLEYLGNINDIKQDYTQNADTFYGNYGKIISQVLNHSSNAKLVMVKIPLPGDNYASFSNAIEEIANHFNIPVINPFDDPFFSSNQYIIRPGGHPTVLGYVGMGYAYERLLSKCIENNLNYFQYSTVG